MKYGLESRVIKILISFFSKYNFIDKVMIFGSRAKGNFTRSSDIDLAIFSKTMSSREFSRLRFNLDELPIFHKIDIIHFERVDSSLQKNIIEYGKILN